VLSGSLLGYKKCSRAEQSLATLSGESKSSCAASVNNKPTFSPCSCISRCDDAVASQRSASACPRAERSSWKKKVSVTDGLRCVVGDGMSRFLCAELAMEYLRSSAELAMEYLEILEICHHVSSQGVPWHGEQ
jgi:hypothetical protein